MSAIQDISPPSRSYDLPFSLCIDNVYEDIQHQLVITGTIDRGFIGKGDKILILPASKVSTVKLIKHNNASVDYAIAGSFVEIVLAPIDATVKTGDVICDPENPIKLSQNFQATVTISQIDRPLMKGSRLMLYMHQIVVVARLKRINSVENENHGNAENPRLVWSNSTISVNIETECKICVDLSSKESPYRRFILRDGNDTIGSGTIGEIIDK